MKKMTCAQVGGGDCSAVFTAETPEEMKGRMTAHAKEAHADMMAKATPESMKEWDEMFQKQWDATPEEVAPVA